MSNTGNETKISGSLRNFNQKTDPNNNNETEIIDEFLSRLHQQGAQCEFQTVKYKVNCELDEIFFKQSIKKHGHNNSLYKPNETIKMYT